VESEFGNGRAPSLVVRLLDGEAMSEICREFGISRKTGYKIFDRYKDHGLEALSDRSRRPVRYANQLPQQLETLIVRLKSEKPHWGARKIRELLVRHSTEMSGFPPKAPSTRCSTAMAWSSAAARLRPSLDSSTASIWRYWTVMMARSSSWKYLRQQPTRHQTGAAKRLLHGADSLREKHHANLELHQI